MPNKENQWFVYMLQCSDDSLYTGITTDIERRINEHNDPSSTSKGAKYTRNRQPVNLVYSEESAGRSSASKREYSLKKLSRAKKLQLIENH